MGAQIDNAVARTELLTKPKLGIGLAFIGGVALSIDIPLSRMAGADPYVVMVARGFGLAIMLWLYARLALPESARIWRLLTNRDFIVVGTLSGANNVFFTLAVFNTTTANVVFILAFNAMLAAIISWPMTGERPSLATIGAIAATILGVWIIVFEGFGTTNTLGDIFALICAFLLAFSLTLTRRSGQDLSLAPAFGGLVSGLFALPTVLLLGSMPEMPIWLAIDALIFVPIAAVTLWLAPRYITAPQVALFYLLETVLAPLWVWMIFAEFPRTQVFIGGAIIIVALAAHTLWEIRNHRARKNPA